MADVQMTAAAAIGGQEAGVVFEGDRRFDIRVRLPDSVRSDVEALGSVCPCGLPETPAQQVQLGEVASWAMCHERPDQTRSAARTASVASS